MENEEEQVDALNQQEDAVLETAEYVEEETIDDVKAKLAQVEQEKAKAEEIAENQRIRAEKAERLAKAKVEVKPEEPKPEAPTKKGVQLTPMDAIMLSKANITEQEDIEQVLEWANFKKIPVSEALKDSTVKVMLAEKTEQRATAAATNTGAARRGTSKVSDEQVLASAYKGQFPDDPEALAEARLNSKKKK